MAVGVVEAVEMDGKRLVLDEKAREFYSEKHWDWLAFAELAVRESGLAFDEANVAWTQEFAGRMASWECLVRAGILLREPDASAWEAAL